MCIGRTILLTSQPLSREKISSLPVSQVLPHLSHIATDTPLHYVAVVHVGMLDSRTSQLLNELGGTVIDIDISQTQRVDPDLLADCDFVLFNCYSLSKVEQESVLQDIRLGTFAPVIVNTINGRSMGGEYVMFALRAGADAVIFASDPLEINIAHCKALLRRWQKQSRSSAAWNSVNHRRPSPFFKSNCVGG